MKERTDENVDQGMHELQCNDDNSRIEIKYRLVVWQEFTQSGGVRPFGVSLLIIGSDDKGPVLYQVDPSGSYFPWKACAIGKNMVIYLIIVAGLLAHDSWTVNWRSNVCIGHGCVRLILSCATGKRQDVFGEAL